jgi:hypothetical protein
MSHCAHSVIIFYTDYINFNVATRYVKISDALALYFGQCFLSKMTPQNRSHPRQGAGLKLLQPQSLAGERCQPQVLGVLCTCGQGSCRAQG